jgi:hypothetical protein
MHHLDPRLLPLLYHWRRQDAGFDASVAALAKAIGVHDRVLILEQDASLWRWRYIGAGIAAFGDRWRKEAIGRSHDYDAPCADYAEALAAEYRASTAHAEPVHNYIVAHLPGATAPLTYRQFLLPWRSRDGRKALMIHTARC